MKRVLLCLVVLGIASCATDPDRLTLAELEHVEADVSEVDVTQSLEMAMEGYRQFLANTEVNAQTPEALRRLADLKIEKEFGAHVGPERVGPERVSPERVVPPDFSGDGTSQVTSKDFVSSDDVAAADVGASLEARSAVPASLDTLAFEAGDDSGLAATTSPREAIAIYQRILRDYPHYARSDQVLYQMARAYDELSEPDDAMHVMDRLVRDFPQSRFIDEVHFRQGEFYFVRRKYLEAEHAYGVIIELGKTSEFYELARYKMGWSLYKQELYEESLHHYLALLDFKMEQGYDFDTAGSPASESEAEELEEERRVADTFRVVSLAFSNLGGAQTVQDYFAGNGHRAYESRIYQNLAEFYVEKLRFNDAAEVYASFIDQNPLHASAPQFSMRVTEIYAEGGFPQLVVASKKDFAQRYGLDSAYWQHFAIADRPDVLGFLKTNLKDLAQHYHAVYQDEELVEERPANYVEAGHWYGQFLTSFPDDEASPGLHYRLADLHLEQGAFAPAAEAYEQTAYAYPVHERSAEAGYAAVFAHRKRLVTTADAEANVAASATADATESAVGADPAVQTAILRETVASSLKFASTFPDHEEAAPVLGRATDDLYGLGAYSEAIAAGTQLVELHADADVSLRRRAWTVISHAHFDLAQFADAEVSYLRVLDLLADDAEERPDIVEALAAAIYQQGDLARAADDHALAAEHFLRVKTLTPDASIRAEAEYDAAAALVALAAWDRAADILNDFRAVHLDHELQGDVTKQLARVYRESGQHVHAAEEYRRIADNADDPEQRSTSLLLAGEFFEKGDAAEEALAAYGDYVEEFTEPLETNVETRQSMAELLKSIDRDAYTAQLEVIVSLDAQAGPARTDRTRYLAAHAALVLAEPAYEYFTGMDLVLPFETSLQDKQARMDKAMAVMENLVTYEVAGVTAAATYYMAEIYRNFSESLMDSERPEGLSDTERLEYDMVLEEEAYPFEERAMEVHLANLELLRAGTHNDWVEKSLDELKILNPARFNKRMVSAGFLQAIDTYAYHSPLEDVLLAAEEAAALADQAGVSEPPSIDASIEGALADVQ